MSPSTAQREQPVKGNLVKLVADKWRARIGDHVAFFGYRWLAWALAVLSLTFPGGKSVTLSRDAGLLFLLAVVNVVLTALAQSYVRLARRRPLILLLDILASATIVWLSSGRILPFLPYALGSLVLPALLFGWRGTLLGSTVMIILDQIGLLFLIPADVVEPALPVLAARVLAPVAFASCWMAIGQFLPSSEGERSNTRGRTPDERPKQQPNGESLSSNILGAAELGTLEHSSKLLPSNMVTPLPLIVARTAPEQRTDTSRRVIYDLTPGAEVNLGVALDQITASFSRQSGIEMRVTVIGSARPLAAAQHSVLLRVAQEALLNIQQHAHAHSSLITLTYEPRAVTLMVQDDGVGLLDGTYERPGLHALRAVRYRLAELDGQLSVFESELGGVIVRATLPFE